MIITGKYPNLRLRRNRKSDWSRRLVQENNLSVDDLILPIFLIEGKNKKIPIKSMPGVYRYSINKLGTIIDKAVNKKIPMVALFPYTTSFYEGQIVSTEAHDRYGVRFDDDVEDGKLVKKRKIPRYFVVPFPQHLQKDKKAK